MVKYTSDTNLIRGAAAAYKDWSNMPGMYEGLDKLGAAGKKAVDDDIKERNDTIDKITIQTTGDATDFGDLSVGREGAGGASGD